MANLEPRRGSRGLFPDLTTTLASLFGDDYSAPFENFNKFKLDIRDEGNHYLVDAELPGFSKEDIDVEYKEPQLIIRAKREKEEETKKDSYVHQERSYGEFVRTFQMHNIKEDEIKGKFENGVLHLEVPKDDTGRINGRKIEIE